MDKNPTSRMSDAGPWGNLARKRAHTIQPEAEKQKTWAEKAADDMGLVVIGSFLAFLLDMIFASLLGH